ncbi:hypothetical protein CEY00_Acc25428 [Actinidia chinensis var. chinensis]|uniref:Uncharacterized protein n=1 Tax=Actinidia chinensis var. chinensis TaxID=1590841 RepID=A0A2R6PYS0_ACTCC|nr:hypothetical protein CEY00_Acc25428 [Actinidia chinensis var. chinensis]
MHLWPTMRIRDSFKLAYLEKLDWNLRKMKSEKNQRNQSQSPSSNQQKLLADAENAPVDAGGALVLCRELLMILSCCYCCFCCGACVDEEEN